MTGQELAQRIPPELAQLGVKIEEDESGYRAITFPDEIKKHFNVLLPVSEIARVDPNYTPAIRAARIDVDQHTYADPNAGQGTRSLNKLGLLALARTAGLGIPQTKRMPAAELGEGKIGWQATVIVRRSDGTPEPIMASKIVDVQVEREKVIAGVRRLSNKTDAELKAIFEKRWLQEREHMEAKCETKAIERAIRAALQVPHAFPAAALEKPFLVVGYSFTPDTTDPEVRRLVIEAGLSASRQLYPTQPARELEPAPTPLPAQDDSAGATSTDPAEGDQSDETAPADVNVQADFAGDEPGAEPEQTSFDAPTGEPAAAVKEAAAAALHVISFGKKHPGRTLEQIAREHGDTDYVFWLATKMDPKNDVTRAAQAAARVYAKAYLGWTGELS